MLHTSIHQGIEFFSETEDQSSLHTWYDNLPQNEVKTSIAKVRCGEYRTYDQSNYRLIVLCDRSFSLRTDDSSRAYISRDDLLTNHNLDPSVSTFSEWIDRHDMPEEVLLGEHYALVDWWPKEMQSHVFSDLSPHAVAQREMENHFLDCLELLRLTTLPKLEFEKLWKNSNEPFFAAGRLVYGDFLWTCEVPSGLFHNYADSEVLLERVGEYSREFVGLMRLASITDAESALLDRVLFLIEQFCSKHTSEISGWQALARDFLDEDEECHGDTTTVLSEKYSEVDRVCDKFRRDLAETTKGLHGEFVTIINAILPTLEMPRSSIHFTDKAKRDDLE